MPAGRENKFARARHHLRSTHLLEGPTNNTSGYFTIEPDVFETIPAVTAPLDLTADDASLAGKDTSGLFDEAGNSLAAAPPGDTSYILGPMVSVYFPDGDYSAIGYVQQDTRKVVNLARIPGTISEWGVGGNVEGFTSYSQLTLEQALWYRDQLIDGNTSSYRVFYIGVFEQLNSESEPGVSDPSTGVDIDEFGRWFGDIINSGYEIEPAQKNLVKQGKKGPDPDMPPGIANPIVQKLRDKFKRGENLTIDDFPSAADFSAFKNGGGNAALRQGKTIGEVIRQGIININGYDSGARLADFDDYMGPAFGNDTVANRERQKAVDARNDALYDYWRDNYVNPDKSVNPQGLTQKQIDDMPDWYKDVSTPPDPNNFAGAFKDTPVGRAVNDFMNDPTHGWWRQAALDAGIGAIGAVVGRKGAPGGLARGKGFTVGATGMNQAGYQAVTGGGKFQVPQGGGLIGKGSRPLLGRGAYSAPQVGQVGPGGMRPGSGASRYAQPGGGVVGSVVPPGARGTNIIEPQKVVSGPTFDKGRRIFQKAFDPKYANTPTAQRIRQQAGQAGFGDSPNIPASQLPTTPQSSMKPGGKSFSNFAQKALGTAAGVSVAADLLTPEPAEGAREISAEDGRAKIKAELGQEYDLEPVRSGKGDHVRYRITKNGVPVQGRGSIVGGGVRGGGTKGQRGISGSFEQGIDNFINAQTGKGKAETGGFAQGGKKVDVKTLKPTTKGRGPKTQPKPTSRSTIKSMPSSMMGKPPAPKPTVQRPVVDPANTNPYSEYDPSKGSSSRLRGSLGPRQYGVRNFRNIRNIRFSNELEGQMLAENRSRILRDIKKPYQLPEAKSEKIKHRPNANRWSTRSVGDGLMKKAEVPTSFKRLEDNVWKKQDRHWNERHSQERKNMILDAVGTSDHAWEYITDRSASGNDAKMYENFGQGIKNKIIEKKKIGNDYIIKMYNEEGKVETVTQSILNERLQRQHELKEQETIYAPKDPLVARIKNKLYSQIDYPDKPAKLGYPDEPPKQMIGGYHPEYGDRHAYYNRLDRHSADTMQNAPTQDLKIDMKVQKQTTRQKALNIVNNIRAAKAQYAKATKKNK